MALPRYIPPPPPPVSREEFERRYKAGARTLFELDPALGKWQKRNRRDREITLVIGLASVVLFLLLLWAGVP